MAYQFYVTIQGAKQGQFKGNGGGVRKAREGAKGGKIAGVRFLLEATSPRDLATGHASGKRQYKPIQITKEWDASSPQLFQALIQNEVLKSVLFELVETNDVHVPEDRDREQGGEDGRGGRLDRVRKAAPHIRRILFGLPRVF